MKAARSERFYLTPPQLCQKLPFIHPGGPMVLDVLVNPILIFYYSSATSSLMFSSCFFPSYALFLPSFLFILPPLHPLTPSTLLSNLSTREAELISCQAAAGGHYVCCHRVKGLTGLLSVPLEHTVAALFRVFFFFSFSFVLFHSLHISSPTWFPYSDLTCLSF